MSTEEANSAAVQTAASSDPAPRGKRIRLAVTAGAAAAIALGTAAYYYAAHAANEHAASVVRDVPWLDGQLIRFSSDFARRSGISFAPCAKAALSPVVSVTGTVAFDPERVAAVGARISGRVRKIAKYEGDAVKKGDLVVELESAELGAAQAAVLAARAHADAAIANAARESQLADAHVSSRRDAELANATAAAAKAELFAAEQKVRAFGGGSRASEIGILPIASPIDGKLVKMFASRGQSVEPSFTLFQVADLGRLWIELAVFERELGHVRVNDEVEISPQTNPSIVLRGTVAHVGDVIDLETRSADVRVVVDNPEESLRPGQSVLAKIHTSSSPEPALLIPLDAVTSVDGKSTVFVAHGETSVEPRTVKLGGRDGARVEITSGLAEGERIVVGGVFPLKSEIFR